MNAGNNKIIKEELDVSVEIYALTDVGRVRAGNEDNFLIAELNNSNYWIANNSAISEPFNLLQQESGMLIAVADGMGGAMAGEVASRLAVSAVRDIMLQSQNHETLSKFSFSERLRFAIEQANTIINKEGETNVACTGMGTTFTAVGVNATTAYLAQVGDSRVYLIRDGRIAQITKDQSLVGQLVEQGYITEEEAEVHAFRNIILQALGVTPNINVVIDKVPLCQNDILLLCSDGLSGKIRRDEMLGIIKKNSDSSIREICRELINLANERGGEDNITLIMARFGGKGLKEPVADAKLVGEYVPRDEALPYEIDEEELISLIEIEDRTLDQNTDSSAPESRIEEQSLESTIPDLDPSLDKNQQFQEHNGWNWLLNIFHTVLDNLFPVHKKQHHGK